MIVLDLSILNQKGTPMFNSDIFANRPAFGIVGRIFISTDTAAIYRDTGTAWDLIADGGSSSTNIYNSNGTLSANRVVSDGGFGLSFTPTTHIGTAAIGGGGSGKLIVGSSTADNGIQIFGANSPSLRIDNAQSGGTQRFVFGLATATNNFIQGATAGEFCISTQSAGNMLFGMWQTINASEVMRITTANNLLIGSTVDTGFKLNVNGTLNINLAATIGGSITTNSGGLILGTGSGSNWQIYKETTNSFLGFYISGPSPFMSLSNTGNLLVGTTLDSGQKLIVNGSCRINGQVNIFDTTQSTSSSTGSLVLDGGLGIAKNIYSNGNIITNAGTIAALNGGSIEVYNTGNSNFFDIKSVSGNFALRTNVGVATVNALTVTSTGNLLVGSTTDTGERLQVTGNIIGSAIIYGARFVSNTSFTANCIFNTFTTIYTMTSTYAAMYLVIVALDGQNTADWAASAIIYTNGSSSSILTQQNGTLVNIQTSGLNIQVRQTGTSPDLNMSYRILKIGNV